MKRTTQVLGIIGMLAMASCGKDDDIIITPPSDGTTITFTGGLGEANAVNSVYVDLSTNKIDSNKRASWDLGFYSGSDFRVILNNTTSAGAKVTTATSLSAVTAADTIGLTLATSQTAPAVTDLAYFDAIDGNLNNTVIPTVSATAADNKVIILNRGTGGLPPTGSTPPRPWIKLKVTRNASGGYTVQYGRITETTNFTTVDIPKDATYNFKYVSLDNGAVVNVEPAKTAWDFTWGYSVFQTDFGGGLVPYNFSDLISVNYLNGVQVTEEKYADLEARNKAYIAYNKDSIATATFSTNRWAIGSNWRVTSAGQSGTGGTGVKTTLFYVLKDPAGNYYKIKFISMGVGDGGKRGYPVFEYKLIK